MITIKSYTDLEQSRTLSEFLSHESADQTWERIVIAGANLDVQDELQYKHNGDMPFSYYSGIGIPCWSFAALLNVLPEPELIQNSDERWMLRIWDKNRFPWSIGGSVDPVDACYEMIIKLHEREML